jgi:hypothetical protein
MESSSAADKKVHRGDAKNAKWGGFSIAAEAAAMEKDSSENGWHAFVLSGLSPESTKTLLCDLRVFAVR